MKLRVLENFAGICTRRMALENLGIDHEVVGITEIDKFTIKSYEAIHGKVNNLGDISLVDPNDVPDHDLFTYSFPCQDISIAGKGKGFEKGSGTRSGLLWECEKVIRVKKPKYLLMENVKNLVSKKFLPGFEEWLSALEELGYTNYWQVLNAKDYGIPQNRERVFCVSILGEHEPYAFPEKEKLELRLKDILEHEVDEKFYLSEEKTNKLIINSKGLSVGYIPATNGTQHQSNTIYHTDSVSPSMTASDYKSPIKVTIENEDTEPKVINPLKDKTKNGWHFEQQVYDSNGITRAVKAGGGSGNIPKVVESKVELSVLIKNNTKQGYVEATDGDGIDLAFPSSNTRRGRVQKDLAQTLDTSDSKGVVENLRIRKLTPKECWRLMGISDNNFEKAAYELRKIIFKGGNESWNVKLADVTESQIHENMETFALNITKDLKGQEGTLTEWIKSLKTPENEKEQNVNVVIEKLGELAHSDSATNIIRCTNYMETLSILMEEKDPLHTVIIELDPKVSTSTAKYMRITSEESLNPLKLSIILTLIERITESKIFISTLRKVNICGRITVTENLLSDMENQIELSLKTEAMFTRVSASQLYKQAGNAIVVDVLEAIFKNMFK